MVAVLTQMRTEVKDAVAKGVNLKVVDYFNETLTAPVVVVMPGDPYVTPGDTFGQHEVQIELMLVSGKGTNKTVANNLDAMIENVIDILVTEWNIGNVRQPGVIALNGNKHLATVLSLNTAIKFN